MTDPPRLGKQRERHGSAVKMGRRRARTPISGTAASAPPSLGHEDWARVDSAIGVTLRAEAREQIAMTVKSFVDARRAECAAGYLDEAKARAESVASHLRGIVRLGIPSEDENEFSVLFCDGRLDENLRRITPATALSAVAPESESPFWDLVHRLYQAARATTADLEREPAGAFSTKSTWRTFVGSMQRIIEQAGLPSTVDKSAVYWLAGQWEAVPPCFAKLVYTVQQSFVPRQLRLHSLGAPGSFADAVARGRAGRGKKRGANSPWSETNKPR